MVNATTNGSNTSALSKRTDGDVRNRAGIASYTKHWNADSTKDTAEQMDARKDAYTDVVVSPVVLSYQVVLLLCCFNADYIVSPPPYLVFPSHPRAFSRIVPRSRISHLSVESSISISMINALVSL